ncbi:hypothetical protein E5676_scaffold500G00270 [Cucumis melo var. makuwa]|uniref:Uncharacterized protein n=1 Tax=Cucumis melo var. makuwa TaxID=1194695 RepID=A0A5D3DIV2_CUCMM|nr:hypothetical protein E6C27_scaffold184G00270 [Cucumis melo var. makuwa]TYK23523.1 hypothetical protein E5676_scaffold500G00270 [Cucumis melo var. makuwa]
MFYYFPVYKFFGYKDERHIFPVQTYAMYYCPSITLSGSWRPYLFIGLAMKLHTGLLSSVTAQTTGVLEL